MVFTTKQMFDIAEAAAIEQGPRILTIEGKQTAVYALSRNELKMIFAEHLYQTRRKTWLQNIEDWRMYGAIVPKGIADRAKLEEPFHVIFTRLLKPDMVTLQMYAEDQNVPTFPSFKDTGVTA